MDIVKKFQDAVLEKFGVLMVNNEKVERVVKGTSTSRGLVGGVGENASLDVVLAKYDQMLGYITKDGFKVKNGTFVDRQGKPVATPKIVVLVKMNGEIVEHSEDEPETLEIKVAKQQVKKQLEEKKEKKVKKESFKEE